MLTENVIAAPDIFSWKRERTFPRPDGVQWTNPLEHSDWDAQVLAQNHPGRSFFHGSAWANVLTETYGYEPFYFFTRESGSLHSLLLFMEVRSGLTGNRAIGLPFTDDCAPLCADKTEFDGLLRNAIELGRARGWKHLEFRGGQNLMNGTPPALSFYGHSLDLPNDENVFFGQLGGAVRRAIRKAEKSGVRVEISREMEAVREFYLLHGKSRKKHGLPPQPFSFFENIHKHVLANDLGVVVIARWKKVPVAAAVFFCAGRHAIYKFGASDDAFQHLRGNNMVFWEAIRWFSRRGARKLDFGRTDIGNEGLRRFKLGWNASETTVGYYRFCLRQEKFVSTKNEAVGWHNGVFRALPRFASRWAGEILYRHWA